MNHKQLGVRLDTIEWKMDRILSILSKSLEAERSIMSGIQDIVDNIEQQKTVVDGVVTLVNSLEQTLKSKGVDQAVIDNALAGLKANTAKLADALVANTPAEDAGAGTGTSTT